jgi:dimethylhistidine N-methyltransferase
LDLNAPRFEPLRAPQFFQHYREDTAAIRAELAAGLLAPQARTSPKYLYDTLGSRLFEAITALPEYYPTRTEAAIFAQHSGAMAAAIRNVTRRHTTLIDLGAGNCEKAASLFHAFEPSQYVAVDISAEFLRQSLECLQRQFPGLDMVGVGMDFSESLTLPDEVKSEGRVFFYPGSSIGNFTPHEAVALLKRVRAACDGSGGLLIGIDMVKDTATLEAAYDDALGVTAAFNRNLLLHTNTVLDTDFDINDWQHVGLFNAAESRIEMHLEAVQDVSVRVGSQSRCFAQGERIHTENSYKYTPESAIRLLESAGYSSVRRWTDERGWFSVLFAQA